MASYKRTIEVEDLVLKKYIVQRDEYQSKAKPIIESITKNSEETKKIMEEAKAKIDKLNKDSEKSTSKISKMGQDFLKTKKKIQNTLEKLEKKNRTHKYEYLESIDVIDGKVQITMIDALEKAVEDAKKQIDDNR